MGIENAKWYILHTYSGYENQVEMNLKMVFEKNNLTERLFEITIPMEEVLEEKNGKKKLVKRKMFPCYVFIKMDYDNSMWHIITQTRGVTGFVGPMGRPLPLTEDEIRRMGLEKVVAKADYEVGDVIKIVDGPLKDFVGNIETIDKEAQKCRVSVSMFGRQTPVDLEFYQIEPITD
ncbi:MAG: transcription termination/antitermination factor NusG [Clostridia bacterium]|nr:transcription termination/antitermination factor NusG [Clostridia bacterium]